MKEDATLTIYLEAGTEMRPQDSFYSLTQALPSGIERVITSLDQAGLDDHLIMTALTQNMSETFSSRENNFSLLLTDGADFTGLDGQIEARASCVVRVGNTDPAPALSIVVDADAIGDTALVQAAAEPKAALGAVLVFIEDYVALWDNIVQEEHLPSRIKVVVPVSSPPPQWFLEKMKSFDIPYEVLWYGKGKMSGFCDENWLIVRDNQFADRLDWELASLGLSAVSSKRSGTSKGKKVKFARLDEILKGYFGKGPVDVEAPSRFSAEQLSSRVNIVCYQPSYLFADLVKRFESIGCVHSDFPLSDAGSYIWMRPQELIAFADLVTGGQPRDVSSTWESSAHVETQNFKVDEVQNVYDRSVAIHHGTCFDPIVQFDPLRLATNLGRAGAVAGVCQFEECYAASGDYAERSNFEFVPIGYDADLFRQELIREGSRGPTDPFRIGFVGRAYGTDDPGKLERSDLAHPKGYRKGGDHLLNIVLRLKLRGITPHVHILGQNWDELVEKFVTYGIEHTYSRRDQGVAYEDYPSVYAKFDALLISARGEGGPVSAIEALSMGVPVVGTSVGVIPYLAQNHSGCYEVPIAPKWGTIDYEVAVAHLLAISQKPLDLKARLAIRESIGDFSTQHWVERLKDLALKTARAGGSTFQEG